MTWTAKSTIGLQAPDIVTQMQESVSSIVTPISDVLSASQVVLDTAKALYVSNTDPLKAVYSAFITELRDYINNALSSGVFILVVNPFELSPPLAIDNFGMPRMSPAQAISAASTAFDDIGDPHRPTFGDSTDVTAFGYLVTAGTLTEAKDLLTKLNSVFNLDIINKIIADFQKGITSQTYQEALALDPYNTTTIPTKPDFQSMKISDIPAMRGVATSIGGVLNYMEGLSKLDDPITQIIDVIQAKIDTLESIVSDFEDLISAFTFNLSVQGVYQHVLSTTTGGVTKLKSALRTAGDLSQVKTDYTALFYVCGGGVGDVGTASNFGLNQLINALE